ncbi:MULTISPECIES: bacterioferritin [Leptospira]|uniref:Bacterioferritin n=2 Tax=Leptospira TaxID=171 RepID=A0A2N0AP63_9LEPT|nr:MULTISPECIES: bacterioferritin [Leptospira]EKJ85598.1 bacterioferritin [Leptospira meyeri serovar Hardjo str. Went 5]EMJ86214.1 bacterioferritin [Leptospira meyeri serovar Semaranga str. Veldrot Semarang 173]PJZ86083.1 bacterioferritin [Leptospira harrisiae]PKA09645.1 bacterioferritin [Leptospira harrisiae]TDY71453.1 bacterioferritin [Leptospira meyeri]
MKGKKEVIDILAEVLAAELTAINQYFIHAKVCKNWGYLELAEYLRKESIEEMKHADEIIERILFFDGTPDLQKYLKINVGQTVPEMLDHDLQLEYNAVERLNRGIDICVAAKDNGTRELFEKILVSEEEHIDWIETQKSIIDSISLPNYLAQKLGDSE